MYVIDINKDEQNKQEYCFPPSFSFPHFSPVVVRVSSSYRM